MFSAKLKTAILAALCVILMGSTAGGQWVTRDHRWPTRGPWMWALPRELPELYREFNGIDFGHAHIAETLLRTQDLDEVERARLEVLDFIFSRPAVPPDEKQIAPTFARLAWEAEKAFSWAHRLHRSLYDLFAADGAIDKEAAYRRILDDYLSKPEAITPLALDHHHALWSFPESRSFHEKFTKFNTQIWAYHWLQAAAYDVQLLGDAARQRKLFEPVIAFYHDYLRNPPTDWEMMPMMMEGAPRFSSEFPEAAAIFDNLHMLHDNINDVLASPELFPTHEARRKRIVELVEIYLHRNHVRGLYSEFRHDEHEKMLEMLPGVRPPSVQEVLGLEEPDVEHQH
jgi:hypothetical protein